MIHTLGGGGGGGGGRGGNLCCSENGTDAVRENNYAHSYLNCDDEQKKKPLQKYCLTVPPGKLTYEECFKCVMRRVFISYLTMWQVIQFVVAVTNSVVAVVFHF